MSMSSPTINTTGNKKSVTVVCGMPKEDGGTCTAPTQYIVQYSEADAMLQSCCGKHLAGTITKVLAESDSWGYVRVRTRML